MEELDYIEMRRAIENADTIASLVALELKYGLATPGSTQTLYEQSREWLGTLAGTPTFEDYDFISFMLDFRRDYFLAHEPVIRADIRAGRKPPFHDMLVSAVKDCTDTCTWRRRSGGAFYIDDFESHVEAYRKDVLCELEEQFQRQR